jgi:uncharacterized protein GlcG (DUF336 family)
MPQTLYLRGDPPQGRSARWPSPASLFSASTPPTGGRIVIFAGGAPSIRDGEVVGAVGVSGGTPDEDHEVAEAGTAAFG